MTRGNSFFHASFFVLGIKCDKNAKKCRFLRCVRTQRLKKNKNRAKFKRKIQKLCAHTEKVSNFALSKGKKVVKTKVGTTKIQRHQKAEILFRLVSI